MPRLIRGPLVEARNRYFDSARWSEYEPRADDIVIATYPKCGTTWMQRIVGMLIFQSDALFDPHAISPWFDMRLPPPGAMQGLAASQSHRRFFKSHMPYDALPIYEGVKFIHVARDGRDSAMSFHNHKLNYTDDTIASLTETSLADPKFASPYKRTGPDAAAHFHAWIEGEADHIGDPLCGFWHMENSYWAVRDDPDVLLVHYNDLKTDLEGEIRRIANYLGIEVPEDILQRIVEAAKFESMKKKAKEIMASADALWQGGGDTFLHKGTNGRWRDVVAQEDLDRYDGMVKENFSPELAHWIEFGRLGAPA